MGWTVSGNIKGPAGTPGAQTWAELSGKPAVIAAGATTAEARTAIGAENAADKGQANGYASLDANGKVPTAQLPSSIMEYKGVYNASTNSPSLSNGSGDTGDVYRIGTSGSRNFGAGAIALTAGDYVIYNGSVWERSSGTDAVTSVAGRAGAVTLSVADLAADTSTVLGVGGLDIGGSDTSVTRLSAGRIAVEGVPVLLMDTRGQVADLSLVIFGANKTRSVGTGDFPFGVKLRRAIRFSNATFRAATADASGSMTVELRKNGAAVAGSQVSISATSQVDGGTAEGTWDFAAGDVLTVHVTAVGSTPGKGLIADVAGLTT